MNIILSAVNINSAISEITGNYNESWSSEDGQLFWASGMGTLAFLQSVMAVAAGAPVPAA